MGDSQGLEKRGAFLGSPDADTRCCCLILSATEQALLVEPRWSMTTGEKCHSSVELW